MPTLTSNFSLNKPLVNDPVDEDLWGGQLNTNMDTIDQRLAPTGSIQMYAGTTAPNSDWLLCDGSGVSRSTYSELFALISTTFGSSDSLTFKVPDLRGRTAIGLDNLGGTSADRITDSDADTLGGSGGAEEQTPTGSITINSFSISEANLPSSVTGTFLFGNVDNSGTRFARGSNTTNPSSESRDISSLGSGSSITPTGSFSGSASNVTQPWLALGAIIKT